MQRELETLAVEERRVAVALCDRGTVDGLAYWSGSHDSYWAQFDTTIEDELARYAAVIHLHTPAADQGYNHANTLRIESAERAVTLDREIAAAWAGHPNRVLIRSTDDFLVKAARALEVIRAQLPACCHGHPLPHEASTQTEDGPVGEPEP